MIKKLAALFTFALIASASYADAINCLVKCLEKEKMSSADCAEICSD